MTKLKRTLSLVLCLVLCLSLVPAGLVNAVEEADPSSHVYMIFTNPGEDCTTEMRIGFHSDYLYTDCYVEYTTADDTGFLYPTRVEGTYDDQKYLWFYNRLTTNALSDNRFGTKFLDWGVELYDLTPDTDYIYRVCDGDGAYSKTYSFKTAGAEKYSIIWMSDAHVNEGYTGRINAWRNMFKFAETQAKYDIGFQFSTGDSTTSGDRYGDWLTIANEDFTQKYMIANLVGNHDVYDSIMDDDTVYYTQYWKSGQYFEIVNNNPRNGYTALSNRVNGYLTGDGYTAYQNESANKIIGVDSGVHSGKQITGAMDNTDGRMYWFNYNGILFIIFEYYSMMSGADTKNALDWAGSVIEANYGKYDYIVCANHVNLINGGGGDFRDYGATDYEYFGEFFDKYGVDMFLAGDNHVYLRTNPIYDGAVSSDPNKGTYIIQAPCLSRPQNFTAKDPAGYAVKQYSMSGTTVGGLVIDVDENGLTFNCLVYEMLGTTPYYCYDSFTVPKRDRAPAAQEGYYKFSGETTIYSSPAAGYDEGTLDFTDYTMYVYDTYMNYGLVLGAGVAVWVDLSDATFICGGAREGGVGYLPVEIEPDGYNSTASFYTKEQFQSLIAENAPVFEGMYFYSLHSDGNDFYTVMKSYNDYHNWEACENCKAVLVCSKTFNNGNILTLDRINSDIIVAIASANFSETVPEGIVYAEGSAIAVVGGVANFPDGVSVKTIDDCIINASVVVTDENGNALKAWENVPNGATVTVYNGNSDTAVGSFTVSIPTYTVTFKAEDGTVIESQTVSVGCDAVPPAAPEKEGFEFAGWTADYRNVSGDVETTATYTEVIEEESSEGGSTGDYTPVYGGNRLAGESYTYTAMNSFQGACKDADAVLLTDGIYRGENDFTALGGKPFTSVELAGTYQENIIDFTLNGGREIASIVIKGARKVNETNSVNRHLNIASVYVSTDGLSFQPMELTITEEAIEGAPAYSEDNGVTNYNQFYDITASFTPVEGVVALRVILNTLRTDGNRGYIVQLDEIEAYGAEGPIEPDESSEETSEPASSEESSEESSEAPVEGSQDFPSPVYGPMEIEVDAGSTVYFMTHYKAGMIMTVTANGETVMEEVVSNMFVTYSYTNTADEAITISIDFAFPAGSMDNPVDLIIGDNSADIERGSQGYYYKWIATENGTLTITMPDGNWTYVINNLTTGIYGDTQWSDSDPVVSVADVAVTAGDDIRIMVNNYDPENEWVAPEGVLTFNAAFTADGDESSDGEGDSELDSSETDSSEDSVDDSSSEETVDTVYGDVNSDGEINSLDAAQVLRHDAQLITLNDTALAAADVNGDGTVNSLDAAQILKFDAQLIDSFPVDNAENAEPSAPSLDAIISEDEDNAE